MINQFLSHGFLVRLFACIVWRWCSQIMQNSPWITTVIAHEGPGKSLSLEAMCAHAKVLTQTDSHTSRDDIQSLLLFYFILTP